MVINTGLKKFAKHLSENSEIFSWPDDQVGRHPGAGRGGLALLPGQEGGHLQVIYPAVVLVNRSVRDLF